VIIAAIGGCGSGKTYHLRRLVEGAVRGSWAAVVLDTNGEFEGGTVISDPSQARAALRKHRLVRVKPPKSMQVAGASPWRDVAETLAQAAISHPHPCAVVLPEAHKSCHEGTPLPSGIKEIAHEWRHRRAGLWVDTQHFARLSKEILDESGRLYLFAQGSPRDLEAIRKYAGPYGPELLAAVRSCGAKVLEGEPGWHVLLEPYRSEPPYILRRS
jgi:hypothetical protein